jgi:hypothetical protein
LSSEDASPGAANALVYAKVHKESGDDRCPTGTFSIVDNPRACNVNIAVQAGCAIYKQWDSSGTQVTNRSALGGYVTIGEVIQPNMDVTCSVDMSATFDGGVTIRSTYSFLYNPAAESGPFCSH